MVPGGNVDMGRRLAGLSFGVSTWAEAFPFQCLSQTAVLLVSAYHVRELQRTRQRGLT